jgi:predicted nucleic acid-binding protein
VSYLLDTNVVSDLRRPAKASRAFRDWFEQHQREPMWVSVVTLGEIEQGVSQVERRDLEQGELLRSWFEEQVLATFEQFAIPVDADIARTAARLRVPDPRPWVDSIIAATAIVGNLALVTRNTRDFPDDVRHINPWKA